MVAKLSPHWALETLFFSVFFAIVSLQIWTICPTDLHFYLTIDFCHHISSDWNFLKKWLEKYQPNLKIFKVFRQSDKLTLKVYHCAYTIFKCDQPKAYFSRQHHICSMYFSSGPTFKEKVSFISSFGDTVLQGHQHF